MKTKTFNEDLWKTCVEQYGFIRGYTVIGLKMILVALGDRKLIGWNTRRIRHRKAYYHNYYLQKREDLLAYRREHYRSNIDSERARRRAYYYRNKNKWDKYFYRKESHAE